MTRASGVWASERADIFPALAAGCWFSQSVFSPLGCTPIPSCSSGFFSSVLLLFATRLCLGRAVSSNTHAFPSLRPTRRIVAQSVHVCACRRNLLCISLHRTITRPSAANILFHSIISLTVSSPQSSLLFAFDSFSIKRRIIIVDKKAIFYFTFQ